MIQIKKFKTGFRKKIFTLIATFLIISGTVLAQGVPQSFKYQAVVRSPNGEVINATEVTLRISIIQGNEDNFPIYQELHEVTTNKFGLVNLNIGWGDVLNGDFSTIEWEQDDHFLGVEVSINSNNISYVHMGITQLLSVPYALVAQRSIEGDADADPTNELNTDAKLNGTNLNITDSGGTLSVDLVSLDESVEVAAAQATADQAVINAAAAQTTIDAHIITDEDIDPGNEIQDISISGHELSLSDGSTLTLPDDVDDADADPTNELNTTVVLNGTDLEITDAGGTITTDLSPLQSGGSTCNLAIGNTHEGGIIFYLDASGCHGLVAAASDQSTGIQWYNGSIVDTYAYGNGIGAGEGNSQGIRRWQGTCSSCYASELCQDLTLGGYSDWYLPSKYELNLMYENIGQGNSLGLGNVGGFANIDYWSSTEGGDYSAWVQNFINGSQNLSSKGFSRRVRAVRAF